MNNKELSIVALLPAEDLFEANKILGVFLKSLVVYVDGKPMSAKVLVRKLIDDEVKKEREKWQKTVAKLMERYQS